MTILRNNLQRLFKRKGLIFIILLPIIFTTIYLMGSGELNYTVGIIDLDQSQLSEWMLDEIAPDSDIEILENFDQEEIKNIILKDELDLVVVIQEGYEEAVIGGETDLIHTYFSSENHMAILPRSKIDTKIQQLNAMAAIATSKEELYELLNRYVVGSVDIKSKVTGENNDAKRITIGGIGILVMSMMIFSHSSGTKMNDDKSNGIHQRIMASPLSRKRYSLESMGSLFIMVSLNVIAVMSVIALILGGDFGPNPINVLVVLLVFALVAVAITNLINSISKDRKQANTLNVMITTPLCMLGGCFWPISITPKAMQFVSNFVPTKWVMDAVSKTMSGGALNTVTNELIILLLFSLAMFAVSSSKRIAWSK